MTHSVKKGKLIVFIVGRKKSNRGTNRACGFVRKYAGRDASAQKAGIGMWGNEWRVK
jgi:hypothetical protein